MKSIGLVRKFDDLGRLVIPKEIRKVRGWEPDTPMEFYTDGDKVVIKEYRPGCFICGDTDGIKYIKDKAVCKKCANDIAKNFK